MTIKIGTRRSRLALAQTRLFSERLSEKFPYVNIEIVEFVTHGDRILDKPLDKIGGKGVFVEEIENALKCGQIDAAVHSAKDLPVCLGEGLEISGVLPRGNHRDILITRQKTDDYSGFVIGTGSKRRRMNFTKICPDAVFKDIRGNVDTRLRKLSDGEYDGIILCAAGFERLGISLAQYEVREFESHEFVPSPCQGIIAAECASGSSVSEMIKEISDKETMLCFKTEREIISALGADCTVPVGAYSEISDGEISVIISDRTGKRISGVCDVKDRAELVKELISSL